MACSSKSSEQAETRPSQGLAPIPRPAPEPPVPQAESQKSPIPANVKNAGEFAENLYDAASISDWRTAEDKLKNLKFAVQSAKGQFPNPHEADLDRAIAALQGSVAGKNRIAAMQNSNQITRLAAQMSSQFKSDVPVAVIMLDYYGRELEVGSAKHDTTGLKETAAEIRSTWDGLRAAVVAKGGAAQARSFDATVQKLEQASTVSEFQQAAKIELEEVDKLEKVFAPLGT